MTSDKWYVECSGMVAIVSITPGGFRSMARLYSSSNEGETDCAEQAIDSTSKGTYVFRALTALEVYLEKSKISSD